jgi:hypothetical protein
MKGPKKGRRRAVRMRVFYPAGDRLHPGDLIYSAGKPFLVINWRTMEGKRIPYVTAPLDGRYLVPVKHRPNEYIYRRNAVRVTPVDHDRA